MEEYLDFLGNLVSAQSIYLRPCLRMVVSHFVPCKFVIRFILNGIIHTLFTKITWSKRICIRSNFVRNL